MKQKAAYSVVGVAVFVIDLLLRRYLLLSPYADVGWSRVKIGPSFNNGIWGNPSLAIVVSVVVILGVLLFWLRQKEIWMIGIFALGILGNLFDRIAYGYVIDYITLYRLNFNLADLLIVVGAVGMVVQIVAHKVNNKPGMA